MDRTHRASYPAEVEAAAATILDFTNSYAERDADSGGLPPDLDPEIREANIRQQELSSAFQIITGVANARKAADPFAIVNAYGVALGCICGDISLENLNSIFQAFSAAFLAAAHSTAAAMEAGADAPN